MYEKTYVRNPTSAPRSIVEAPLIVYGPNFWVEGLSASRSVARCSPRDLISPTSVRNRHRNGASGAASTDGPSIGRRQVGVRTSRAPSPQIAVLMLGAKWHRPSQRPRSYPRFSNFLHLEDFQCKTCVTADEAQHLTRFSCHQARVKGHDFVFTRLLTKSSDST